MITVTFIAAIVTGVVLAVKIFRLPEIKETVIKILSGRTPAVTNLSKDDCIARGVIKF